MEGTGRAMEGTGGAMEGTGRAMEGREEHWKGHVRVCWDYKSMLGLYGYYLWPNHGHVSGNATFMGSGISFMAKPWACQ